MHPQYLVQKQKRIRDTSCKCWMLLPHLNKHTTKHRAQESQISCRTHDLQTLHQNPQPWEGQNPAKRVVF